MAELPNIKAGDEVVARFKVNGVDSKGVYGPTHTMRTWVGFEHITEVIPAPKAIKVGDRVFATGYGGIGRVLAIDGDVAWVKNNHYYEFRLSHLTLVEDASGQQGRPRP